MSELDRKFMTPEESKHLDRWVWEALGFGNKWFPPDVPTCGPDWQVEIKSIADHPAAPGWRLFGSFPPVSRDWNLAMWAAGKSGLFYTDSMRPPHALFMLHGAWEIARASRCELYECLHARGETGPLSICRAILYLKEKERVQHAPS